MGFGPVERGGQGRAGEGLTVIRRGEVKGLGVTGRERRGEGWQGKGREEKGKEGSKAGPGPSISWDAHFVCIATRVAARLQGVPRSRYCSAVRRVQVY